MNLISLKIVIFLYNYFYWFVKVVYIFKILNLFCKNKFLVINGIIKILLFLGYYVVIYMFFSNSGKEFYRIKVSILKNFVNCICNCIVVYIFMWKYGFRFYINGNGVFFGVVIVC